MIRFKVKVLKLKFGNEDFKIKNKTKIIIFFNTFLVLDYTYSILNDYLMDCWYYSIL